MIYFFSFFDHFLLLISNQIVLPFFPWLDVYEIIELVLKNLMPNLNERKEIIDDVLHVVDLNDYKKYYSKELSGGMKQRVSITRALAVDPVNSYG